MKDRIILHSDINNFYASAEILRRPELAVFPVAVVGDPALRHGVVLAKNQIAKGFGVITGETVGDALRKCPTLKLVKPDFDEYERLSELVFNLYTRYTDRVEPFGPDECWLDCTGSGILGGGEAIADDIRRAVFAETGLTVSVGVSWNKAFAKLASDLKKPDATTVISRENYEKLVFPLPVGTLMLAGASTVRKLAGMNINTIGELAGLEEFVMRDNFGKTGALLLRYARGEDNEPVRMYYEGRTVKSVGHGTTTIRDVVSYADAYTVILELSDMVAARLRRYGFFCTSVSLSLRGSDLNAFVRQRQIEATCSGLDIAHAAFDLLKGHYKPSASVPLRTITVSTAGLTALDEWRQLSFFETELLKKLRIDAVIDRINSKHGDTAPLKRCALLYNTLMVSKKHSEDFLPFKR